MDHRTVQILQDENIYLKQRVAELEAALATYQQAAPAVVVREREQQRMLPTSVTLYQIVARYFPNGIIALFDHDLRYILVDGTGLEDIGFSPNTLQGRTIREVLPSATSATLESHCRAALAGATTSFEITYHTRQYEVHTLPVYDDTGSIIACLAMTQDITRRKRMEQALQHSERFKQAALDALSAHIAVLDETGTIITVNKAWIDFAEANSPTSSLMAEGANYIQVCEHATGESSEGSQEFATGLRAVLAGKQDHFSLEYPCHAPDEQRWFIAHITRFVIDNHTYLVVAHENITSRKLAEEALHQAQFALDCSADAVVWLDSDGRYLYVNDVACQYQGFTREELLGQRVSDIYPNLTEEKWSRLWQQFKQQNAMTCATEIYRKDKSTLPVEVTGNYLTFKGQEYLCSFIRDITERKAAEEQLRHQALHDTLTDLPNRALFMELLEHALRRNRPVPNNRFAVLFLDLDNFKVVNDSLGHLNGDHLLTITAGRLQKCLRTGDTIARFGGDEFVILLEDLHDEADALVLVYRIQQAFAQPVSINDQELSCSVSIGIVFNSDEHQCPTDLLRDADTAMYQAKALGPGHYAIFDNTMHFSVVQRLDTENALRHAIEQQELRLHYQPIVSLSTGKVTGFEALVRWQHPQRGLLTPNEFIPIAEETGLIIPMGWWVLRTACQQMRHWQEQVDSVQPLTISVNLSSKAFMRDDVVEQIYQILQETGVDATRLKLEITENVMMDHVKTTITKLTQLHHLGFQLCIDDFGTGYSSLRYLHRFPMQILKIDRSFISTLNVNDESAAITQSIVMLSHTLRKKTIAEGIETMAQLHYLQKLHCEYGQGYFFSRPVDQATAETMLTTTFSVNTPAPDPDGLDRAVPADASPLQHQRDATAPCQTIITMLQQQVTELEQRLDTCRRMCAELRQEHDSLWALADSERLDVSHTLTHSGQAEAVLCVWERALATVTNGILITDVNQPDMPIIYCNAAFERMTGYTPAETLGRNCRFLQGSDTNPTDVAEIRAALHAGRECRVILLNYRKDGTPFWNELAISPLHDPTGRLTHYIGVITDVTGRKRIEDALQASVDTFRGFFEQSQDALLLMDAQGSIAAWNQGAEQMFGLSRTETLGQPKWEVLFRVTPEEYRTPAMHARIKAAVLNMIATAAQGNPIHQQPIERETQLPDGTRRTVSTQIFPIQTNTGLLIGGITRDITRLKRTQAAIRESQDRLQAILDNAAVGIVLLDQEGQFIEVNGRWIEMLGMTRYEVYQKTWLDLLSPEDRVTGETAMDALLRGEVAGFRLEQRFRRKDGSLFWGNLSTQSLQNEQGELENVVGIIADITERKQAEQALQLAHAQSQIWVGKLKQRNRDMTLLNELSDVLQTCQTVDDAYQAIIPVFSQLFSNRAGALYIFDQTRTSLELATAWGLPQHWSSGFASKICQTLTHGPLHTHGPGATGVCCSMADSAIPSLCVPLIAHGEPLGVMRLSEVTLPSLLARRRLEHLTVTVADYLALAIANLQLRERLQDQAIRDALTGLFNRRYLDETLQRELQHAARHQHPVGVIMLDVDHFKQFNDRFGHKGGDALLQALGTLLQHHIRSEDIACRYGGEEFLLILPESTLEETEMRAEQIRAEVAQLRITHEQQPLDTVTISIGLAGFPTHGITTTTLISAADKALYHAKAHGRNCVINAARLQMEVPDTSTLCT